jgi:uncharacterized protein YqgC (DUF456 family)
MDSFVETLTLGIVLVMFMVGLVGIFVPLIPGILLIWLAVLFHALSDGFTAINPAWFVLITFLALVTGTSDLWFPLLGARKTGASWQALAAGIIGAIVGTFALPIIGTIAGYAAGVLLAEYIRHGAWEPAIRSGFGVLAGWGIATLFQLVGALLMIAIFFLRVS